MDPHTDLPIPPIDPDIPAATTHAPTTTEDAATRADITTKIIAIDMVTAHTVDTPTTTAEADTPDATTTTKSTTTLREAVRHRKTTNLPKAGRQTKLLAASPLTIQVIPAAPAIQQRKGPGAIASAVQALLAAAALVLAAARLAAKMEALEENPVLPTTTKNRAIFAEARCRKTYSSQFLPVSAGLQNQFSPPIRRKVSSPGQPVGETEKDLRFSLQPESPPRCGDFVE